MNWLARIKTLICRSRVVVLPEFCHECGREVEQVWWCENDEWWARLTSGNEILCVRCFDKRAQSRGVLFRFVATEIKL